MANPEHVEILKEGVEVWNQWRIEQGNLEIDLANINLRKADLRGANFQGVNLSGADLIWAKLDDTDLSPKDLRNGFSRGTNLNGALLHETSLRYTNFRHASLNGTALVRANIYQVNFSGADLKAADFHEAEIRDADFTHAHLQNAIFSYTRIAGVRFGNNDLSGALWLDMMVHLGPSYIGINTIYRSNGHIAEVFLRGCGVPDEFITYMRSLVANPIQFYSCFISYSSQDEEFAERLYSDLQAKGVRVWFAPHDLPIGSRIRPAIDESIHIHDKLLLVLSEASVGSQWVEQEVETALAREREQEGRSILFPVRIDDAVIEAKFGWPALLRNTRNVGDFTRWKDHDSYQRAFDRLLRDLKAEA